MRAALQEYYREVDEKAEQFARESELRERADHLRAFNLGRLAQRVESVRSKGRLRAGWIVAGLILGMGIGRPNLSLLRNVSLRVFASHGQAVDASRQPRNQTGAPAVNKVYQAHQSRV